MIFVDAKKVREFLAYRECIPVMRNAMARLSSDETEQMLRQILPLDRARMFGVMAGTMGDERPWGAKLVSVTPVRNDPSLSSHQGVIVLFEPERGTPTAIIEAGAVTAIRTASSSAMASDLLAIKDATSLAIIGTGEQALHHALAVREVRPIREIRIWGRSATKARSLASDIVDETGIKAVACDHVEDAAREADILCTVTSANEPLLFAHHVKPGAHINLVGSSFDGPREIDDELVALSRFFADSTDSVKAQGAEYRHALAAGAINEAHLLGEIGDVVTGRLAGRTHAKDITIYNSLGHIIQDIAAAAWIVSQASIGASEP